MTKTTTAKTHRKGAGRVAFLARADLFLALLNAGHPQRTIYDDHAANLGISYSQFNRYVGKYLLKKAEDHEHQKRSTLAPTTPAKPGTKPPGPSGYGTSKPSKPGFHHDPNSGNDRDDLI